MATKAGTLLEQGEVAVTLTPQTEQGASMFERLLRDPEITPERLERFMALHERMEAKRAEAAFNAAMSAAQSEMRPIAADASNPQTRSRYASYAALDTGIRPIYTTHGFGLSFDSADSPKEDHVRVLCYATHSGGHSRTYHLDMPADGKGAKGGDVMTKTHATGAAMSYGMRYLLKMVFNIAVGEDDDDGNSNGGKEVPPPPRGFAEWWDDMTAAVDEGLPALERAWGASRRELKEYVQKYRRADWAGLKTKAEKVRA